LFSYWDGVSFSFFLKIFYISPSSTNPTRDDTLDYTEANLGRIFILRLQQNEVIHEEIEKFAAEKQIKSALCFFLGGAEDKSKVVVGPKDGNAMPPQPMVSLLKGVHEGIGVGTVFMDEAGNSKLHMHASFGRNDNAVTGCVRMGVEVWQIGEVVILELTGSSAKRVKNKETGFELLEC
jgi:predicted DNA-binding protein with PD1-like motif